MVIQAYQHHPEPGEETRIGITGHCHGTDLAAAVAHTADPLQDLEAKQEEHKGGGEEEDVLHRQAHFPLLIMSQQLQRGEKLSLSHGELPMAVAKGATGRGVRVCGRTITFAAVRAVSWPANGELVRCSLCSAAHPPLQALTPLQGNPGFTMRGWCWCLPRASRVRTYHLLARFMYSTAPSFQLLLHLPHLPPPAFRSGAMVWWAVGTNLNLVINLIAATQLLRDCSNCHCHSIIIVVIIGTKSVIGYFVSKSGYFVSKSVIGYFVSCELLIICQYLVEASW
jgi:hypothetical protein